MDMIEAYEVLDELEGEYPDCVGQIESDNSPGGYTVRVQLCYGTEELVFRTMNDFSLWWETGRDVWHDQA